MSGKAWFRLHSAFGVFSGLMLFILCWSGSFAVFSYEIDWLVNPAQRVAIQSGEPQWDAMRDAVKAVYPDASVSSLHAPLYPNFAAEVRIDLPDQERVRVHVNPNTAEVLGSNSYFNVQRFFRSFHMSLFDVWGVGYWIVAAFAVPLLISTLTPLVFYKRWWRGFTKLNVRSGLRTLFSDTHKLLGLWGLWFGLLMAITGGWWLFEYAKVDLGYPEGASIVAQADSDRTPLTLQGAVARARSSWPTFEVRSIYLGDDETADPVRLIGQADAFLVRDRANEIIIDLRSHEVLRLKVAQNLGWPARWIDTVDPLHFGNFAGFWVKLVWFVFGLGLSALCLTGTYLHAKRLAIEAGVRQRSRWPGMWSALGASAVVLAASIGYGVEEIRGYGQVSGSGNFWPEIPLGVAVFIIGWVLATLAILGMAAAWLVAPKAILGTASKQSRSSHSDRHKHAPLIDERLISDPK